MCGREINEFATDLISKILNKLAEAWVELANGTHDRDCHPPPHMHDHVLAKAELGGCHLDR